MWSFDIWKTSSEFDNHIENQKTNARVYHYPRRDEQTDPKFASGGVGLPFMFP